MAENIVIKVVTDTKQLDELNKDLVESGKVSQETAKRFTELQQVTTKADTGFKSLKQQVREAEKEFVKLSQTYGETSKQAIEAGRRAGQLKDELGDFKSRVDAFHPDAKFNALNNVISGSIGAFQGLTGAMQLFGSENEEVNKIVQKMQGFLNLTQGLNSVMGLKDAFKDLRIVLTASTIAQEGMAAANTAEATTAEVATVANKGLAASLGPIILLVGALAAAYYLLSDSQEEVADLNENFREFQKDRANELALLKEQGKNEVELLNHRKETVKMSIAMLEAQKRQTKEEKERKNIQIDINDLKREEKLLNAQIENGVKALNAAEHQKYIDELKARQARLEGWQQSAQGLKAFYLQEYKIQSDAISKKLELDKRANELSASSTEELFKMNIDVSKESYQKQIDLAKSFGKETEDELQSWILSWEQLFKTDFDFDKAATEKRLAKEKAAEQEKMNFAISSAQQAFGIIAELSSRQTNARIQDLEAQKNAGIITEEQYQKELKKIRRQQANDEKMMALFNASLGIATAIINSLSPDKLPLIPIIAALGAAQLSVIATRPIPKFKKGTLNVTGGSGGVDDVAAYLNRGEAVIPTEINRAYHPTIAALFNKRISPSELNAFVTSRVSGGAMSVRATLDHNALARAMKSNNKVSIQNGRVIGREIAKELNGNFNIRNVI